MLEKSLISKQMFGYTTIEKSMVVFVELNQGEVDKRIPQRTSIDVAKCNTELLVTAVTWI